MSVAITTALREELQAAGIDPVAFVMSFTHWKAGWPAKEFAFELFGKDGAYAAPSIHDYPQSFRHVHLMPIPGSRQRPGWLAAFRRGSRRTSDRHLVYAQNRANDYLLIFVLDEPTAHAVARMRTAQDRAAMNALLAVAENFVVYGDIP